MENGNKISFLGKALCITKKLINLMSPLIIRIGKKLINIGLSMKDNSSRTARMEKVNSIYQMVKFLKGIFVTTWFGETEFYSEEMGIEFEDCGERIN